MGRTRRSGRPSAASRTREVCAAFDPDCEKSAVSSHAARRDRGLATRRAASLDILLLREAASLAVLGALAPATIAFPFPFFLDIKKLRVERGAGGETKPRRQNVRVCMRFFIF